jgi:hypothetical protein
LKGEGKIETPCQEHLSRPQVALLFTIPIWHWDSAFVSEEGTVMEPHIQNTNFGFITVDGEEIDHDILIRLSGEVKKRKKKLSKEKGDSHTVSLAEAEHIFDEGAERLIIGSGQYGNIRLSEEAVCFFKEKGCSVELHPTPEAIKVWNQAEGKTIGMFHVTC